MKKKKEETEFTLKEKIGGIAFLIWFIFSIFGILLLKEINAYYGVMMFGQFFFVFGIVIFIIEKQTKIAGIPFILVGLACIIVPYLMMKPEINGMVINWQPIIIIVFLLAFILVGLAFILIPIMRINNLKKICTMEIIATVIKQKVTYSEGTKVYCPIYEFEYNGKKYEVMNYNYRNVDTKPIGNMVDLRINPDNPEEFLDDWSIPTISIVLGTLFLLISVPILILVITNGSFTK